MRLKYLLPVLLIFILLACKDSKNGGEVIPPGSTEVEAKRWVFSQFRANGYLWRGELPNRFDLTGAEKMSPKLYFESKIRHRANPNIALSEDYFGDRFSGVRSKDETRAIYLDQDDVLVSGFGFHETSIVDSENKILYVNISNVIPGSSADKMGLKRGDCVARVNGAKLGLFGGNSPTDYHYIKRSAAQMTLSVVYPESREVKLTREIHQDTPIIFDSIYSYQGSSVKTGYLVYNHFSTGGASDLFNEQLRGVFKNFVSESVENVVLDLRFNGGGKLSVAKLLTSLLASQELLGNTFAYMEEAESFGKPDRFSYYRLHSKGDKALGGGNVNAKNIYFITSKNTASSSELVIHSLRALMSERVKMVGGTTYGKNLGGIALESNNKFNLIGNIITLRIYDVNKKSGYETGLIPDAGFKVDSDLINITNPVSQELIPASVLRIYADYGSAKTDPMLNRVMQDIYPGIIVPPPASFSSSVVELRERVIVPEATYSLGLVDDRTESDN